jgi:hypothetical protein
MYKSHAEFRFYDIEMKKFDKKIGFTTSKRSSIFNNNNGVPPPTKYSAKLLDFN